MRISDWSSDVCSSDLPALAVQVLLSRHRAFAVDRADGAVGHCLLVDLRQSVLDHFLDADAAWPDRRLHKLPWRPQQRARQCHRRQHLARHPFRSEEHTSELQSLMRTSYAVFSLKKKNQHLI